MNNQVLYDYAKKYFYKEVECLSNTLIIPLGKAVEEILQQLIKEKLIEKEPNSYSFGSNINFLLRLKYSTIETIDMIVAK